MKRDKPQTLRHSPDERHPEKVQFLMVLINPVHEDEVPKFFNKELIKTHKAIKRKSQKQRQLTRRSCIPLE